jgi:triacylglycerol lipase
MKFPILLAHGIARFDFLGNEILHLDNNDNPALDCKHYFKCTRTMLMGEGFTVRHSNVPFADSVDNRAAKLLTNVREFLEMTGSEKIHIIAHSMGGLDARHMMFNDRNAGRIHERIATLTTISTPHSGSPAADEISQNLPRLQPELRRLGISIAGLNDLTTQACRRFNSDVDVTAFESSMPTRIFTYAGRSSFHAVLLILKPFFRVIDAREGANDGLVSVQSAQWRTRPHQGVWENADHLNELGWFDVDHLLTGETSSQLLARIHDNYRGIAQKITSLDMRATP